MINTGKGEWYDFTAEVDILCKSNGVAGVVFRASDNFNYYAFIIDKTKGFKAIVKVVSGSMTILKNIQDGGILLNDWHRVKITARTGNININISDIEHSNQIGTEKTLEVTDYTFVKGFVGLFVNGMNGFYFDNLIVKPERCWSQWTPKKDIKIMTVNANIYIEDFRGDIADKFKLIDPDSAENGPGHYTLTSEDRLDMAIGLRQNSLVFDTSPKRFPSMALIQDKILGNGSFRVSFVPDDANGIVSIIFKHTTQENRTGQYIESYYAFDIINSNSQSQFLLRKIIAGQSTEIKSVTEVLPQLHHVGYVIDKKHNIYINCTDTKITIRMSIDVSDIVTVMEVNDDSIRSGLVGVGTSRTTVNFNIIELYPPQLELTEGDKNLIMNTDLDDIPMPSIRDIKKAVQRKRGDSLSNNLDTIEALSSMVGSTLGYDFVKGGQSSNKHTEPAEDPLSGVAKSTDNGNVPSKSAGWKVCTNTRNSNDRINYCKRTFPTDVTRNKCQVFQP